MALLGLDLGGTKLALGLFDGFGKLLQQQQVRLNGKSGAAAGAHMCQLIAEHMGAKTYGDIEAIGVAIPGIYNPATGRVWAPNIPGWEDYPLQAELEKVTEGRPVMIDSDRACCILGEAWMGSAQNSSNAIFLTVGTGIAAGIMADGHVLRGAGNIAGALGWMAIDRLYEPIFEQYGCLEAYASGEGMVRLATKLARQRREAGDKKIDQSKWDACWKAGDIIAAAEGDDFAQEVLSICIDSWAMTTANLVSIFNPEQIIFGGGIFGPAIKYIPEIKKEAEKWAQPISRQVVEFLPSTLGGHAALYGAACLAGKDLPSTNQAQNVQ